MGFTGRMLMREGTPGGEGDCFSMIAQFVEMDARLASAMASPDGHSEC